MPISPGRNLLHYRLIERIGEGGMGVVWKALDTNLEREVAIKILPEALSSDTERMARFEREAKLLGSLNHPNIATVYGLHDSEGIRFIAMEFISGEDLSQRLSRGALPIDEASDVAAQIAAALDAAHERGVIHRDLKPANVRLTEQGNVKVLDFGLAKTFGRDEGESYDPELSPTVTSDSTRDGVILGTAAYMSPEQARGRSVDRRSDVWAFGCLFYECLTARKAFPGETISDTLAAILKGEPDWEALPHGTPQSLRRLLRRCLAKESRRRLSSLADARLEIEEAAEEPPASPAPSRPRSLSSLRLILPIVAALVIIAAAFLFAGRTARDSESAIRYQRLTYQIGFLSGARFTADGRSIAYSGVWGEHESKLSLQRLDSPVPIELEPGRARVTAVSPKGEIAVIIPSEQLSPVSSVTGGTLATVPLTGGTPRDLLENAISMDWDSAGERIAVVVAQGNRQRLEYPPGQVIHETSGNITSPRISPAGDGVAFLDHPLPHNNRGFVAIASANGEVRTLTIEHEGMTGLAWSPDGSELWFSGADEHGEALFAVSRSGQERILKRMPSSVRLFDVFRDGHALVSLYPTDMYIAARAPGDAAERDFAWRAESFVTDISADGQTLLFSERSLADNLSYETWIRGLDGTRPVRLGPGMPFTFSSDGKWALSQRASLSLPLTILPTGAGEPRVLQNGLGALWATWLPGDKSIVLAAVGPAGDVHLYVQELAGGPPTLVSDDEIQASAVQTFHISPDGRLVAALGADGFIRLFPLDGGESSVVPGAGYEELPLGWTADGRSLYVWRWSMDLPKRVWLIDVETGERSLWRELIPSDPAGVRGIPGLALTPDGQGYAYSYFRGPETLYLLSGLE
jgi:serine/threonine protein kinase/WD40 repeat protein